MGHEHIMIYKLLDGTQWYIYIYITRCGLNKIYHMDTNGIRMVYIVGYHGVCVYIYVYIHIRPTSYRWFRQMLDAGQTSLFSAGKFWFSQMRMFADFWVVL